MTKRELDLLETVPEEPLGRVARAVTRTLTVPIAVVALARDDRVLLKSSVGLPEPWASVRELTLSASFCDSVVATKRAMVVPDRWKDATLRHRLPELDVAAYAGVPLISSEGVVLGTLSALDPRPRHWREDEIAALTELAIVAATQVELYLSLHRWRHSQDALRESQERLQQAQQLASVGLFAGGIAHDFNNLLTVILSSAELLSNSLGDRPQSQEELREIEGAALRGAVLTRQVLAFARKQVAKPELIDVNDLTSGIERMLRRLIDESIELTIDLTPSPSLIWADAGQLEQVLVNLGLNARDAMHSGGRLRIATAVVQQGPDLVPGAPDGVPGPHVEIAISHTGKGMTPEAMARIFDPLPSAKPQGKGAGLGLAVSYGIVRQNGGHITVTSTPDQETTFRVYFPLVDGEVALTVPRGSAELPEGNETILIAEDNAALRGIAARTLRELGYTVLEAEEGAQALEIAAAHRGPIHLLIADVIMPGLSGQSLAEELRRTREPSVLFVSGYAADVLQDVELGGKVAFLGKPYTPTRLARQVRELLDSASG